MGYDVFVLLIFCGSHNYENTLLDCGVYKYIVHAGHTYVKHQQTKLSPQHTLPLSPNLIILVTPETISLRIGLYLPL